jgi:hypothetical protein
VTPSCPGRIVPAKCATRNLGTVEFLFIDPPAMYCVLLTSKPAKPRGTSDGLPTGALVSVRNSPRMPYPAGEELEHEHNKSENEIDCRFHDEYPPLYHLQI